MCNVTNKHLFHQETEDQPNKQAQFVQMTHTSIRQLIFTAYQLYQIRLTEWAFFTFMWPCIVTNSFITKPTRCTNFTNLFWHATLHVSDTSSVRHQEFIHCTLSNGKCHTGL